MITRSDLATYLHDFLACETFSDYAPNGLQVEGRERISVICTAVTASADAIREAVRLQADALLVHHGYFWRGEVAELVGMKYARIAQLIRNDLNLFAYHLPLDCHLTLGNNACLARRLGMQSVTTHRAGNTAHLLWSGRLPHPMPMADLEQLITDQLERKPLVISGHDRPLQSLAWCSGGAQDFIVDAKALGVDAYLSGEISERTCYQARELGISYVSCGHHASERYGIQALGQHLAEQYGLTHHFIDNDNPV